MMTLEPPPHQVSTAWLRQGLAGEYGYGRLSHAGRSLVTDGGDG
jgi:hypothetical protein